MVRAFFGPKFLQDFADIPPKIVSGSRTVFLQEMLGLGEHPRRLLAGDAAGFQKAADRGAARRDAPLSKQVPQPRQGGRRTGFGPILDPCPMALQLRLAAPAHRFRTGRSRVRLSLEPSGHRRSSHAELPRNAAAAFARQHFFARDCSQVVRTGSRP